MRKFIKYLSPIKVFITLIVLTTLINVSFAQDAPAVDTNPDQPKFSTDDLFPAWDEKSYKVKGIAGRNEGALGTGENKLFLQIVPAILDIMIKFAAPAVFVMMVFSGLRFIYSMDKEDEKEKAKKFFLYCVLGLLFILLSYSLMKAIYFIFLGN